MNSSYTYDSYFNTDLLNNNSVFDTLYEELVNSVKDAFYDAVGDVIYDTVEGTIYDTFEDIFEQKLANWWKIAVIIIIIESCIGLVGNVLSLIVWNIGKRSSKMACSTYFKILAASDILTILSAIFGFVLPHFFEIMETNYCAVLGIVFNFLIPLAPQLSAWIIVSVSVERLLSLCFPFRFRGQGYRRRAWISCFAIIILLAGLNYNIFLCTSFVSNDDLDIVLCTCVGSETSGIEGISVVWFLCVLPFIAVAFCNIVIAIRLCWVRRSSALRNSSNRQYRLRQFTKLCIGAAILHCVSVMPLSITMFYLEKMISLEEDEMELDNFSDIYSLLTFLAALMPMCIALFFLNNSLNFLLYCFTGSNFKKDFKELCLGCFCKYAPTDAPRRFSTQKVSSQLSSSEV